MAKISLRSYTREIETLIDHGQIDEAIAHCKQILQVYPKLIIAYRLLGKAYLESQRYGDAADIFQRVLSCIPDDFVSHVGMSIIREDEANLDSAIWHMERAFEVQPYNAAIQGELRRLFGKRDNVEPPKIRLTRGALARMYSRGELYQQAISELRAGLVEDPQRPDLQALLARMYYLSDMRVEAVELCSGLLKKLPFCLEANRLLCAILPETERREDTEIYCQRVVSMDPYLAKASPRDTTADRVNENVATIEKLDWKRGMSVEGTPTQPTWAASLGVSMDDFAQSEEALPDWLTSAAGESAETVAESEVSNVPPFGESKPTETFPWETPVSTVSSEEEGITGLPEWISPTDQAPSATPALKSDMIPDWMKEAGWEPSSGKTEEQPASIFDNEEQLAGSDLQPAELPDWLKAMAPPEAKKEVKKPPTIPEKGGEVPPWLQNEPPGPSETVLFWLQQGADEKSGEEEIPPTSAGGEVRAVTGPVPEIPTGEQIPDWLKAVAPETPTEEKVPETVRDYAETVESETLAEDVPDWLKEITQGTPSEETLVEARVPAEDITIGVPEATDQVMELQTSKIEEIPDWLQTMREEAPAETAVEPETTLQAEEAEAVATEGVPDWLQAMAPEAPTTKGVTAEPEISMQAEEPEPVTAEGVPDWLRAMAQEIPVAEETPAEPEIPMQAVEAEETAVEAIPDWLQAMAQEIPKVEESPVELEETPQAVESKAVAGEAIPDWLQTMAAGAIIEETPVEEEIPEKATVESELEELAEEPESTVPEQATFKPIPEVPPVEVPDWLKTVVEGQPAEEIPQAGIEEERPSPEEAVEIAAVSAPEWLEQTPVEEILPPAVEAVEEEVVQEVSQPPEEVTVEAPPEAALTDQDAALAWLESLAARQGAPEEEMITKPEERPGLTPAWIETEAPVEQPVQETVLPTEPEAVPIEPTEIEIEGLAISMESIVEEQPPVETAVTEQVQPQPGIEGPPPEVFHDQDAALAWLESLAARQGAPEEELITKPEERIEIPLVSAQIVEPISPITAEAESIETLPVREAQPTKPDEELPEWIAEAIAEQPSEEIPEMPPVEGLATPSEAETIISQRPPSFQVAPKQLPTEPIDLNVASLVELENIPGIGFILAQNIINYRATHGLFKNLDDLSNVDGINSLVMGDIEGWLVVKPVLQPEPIPSIIPSGIPSKGADQVRAGIAQENISDLILRYEKLIQNDQNLEQVIFDLMEDTNRHPAEASLWQTLGDAYFRNNQLQEALDAYNRAEDALS